MPRAPGGTKNVAALLLRGRDLEPGSDIKPSLSMSLPGMKKSRCYIVNASLFEDGAMLEWLRPLSEMGVRGVPGAVAEIRHY